MNKKRFLLPLVMLLIALLLLFRLLRTTFLTRFLTVAAVFGPGMAVSYGLTYPGFQPLAYLALLLFFEVISVLLVYVALNLLPIEQRFENKILDKVALHVHKTRRDMMGRMDSLSVRFRRNFGDLGFYMALALISFAYGVYVAGAIAYFLRIRLRRAMVAIGMGALVSIVFWWFLAIGAIPFVTPLLVIGVTTGASIVFFAYGWVRENRIIERISGELMDKGGKLARGVMDNIDKVDPRI